MEFEMILDAVKKAIQFASEDELEKVKKPAFSIFYHSLSFVEMTKRRNSGRVFVRSDEVSPFFGQSCTKSGVETAAFRGHRTVTTNQTVRN